MVDAPCALLTRSWRSAYGGLLAAVHSQNSPLLTGPHPLKLHPFMIHRCAAPLQMTSNPAFSSGSRSDVAAALGLGPAVDPAAAAAQLAQLLAPLEGDGAGRQGQGHGGRLDVETVERMHKLERHIRKRRLRVSLRSLSAAGFAAARRGPKLRLLPAPAGLPACMPGWLVCLWLLVAVAGCMKLSICAVPPPTVVAKLHHVCPSFLCSPSQRARLPPPAWGAARWTTAALGQRSHKWQGCSGLGSWPSTCFRM